LADYRGYFDALTFLMRIDSINRKQGTVLSADLPLHSFLSYHVLAYGTPPSQELSSLEQEMLFSIFSRMSAAFNDYASLCAAIKERQRLEDINPLPPSVKRTMFARDEDEEPGSLSVAAAHRIYGDVFWEHVFSKIMHDVRFALEKGSLDCTGPIELLNCSPHFAKLALALAKKIHAGKLSEYVDPDSETTDRLTSIRRTENPYEEAMKDIAVVITPSPQALEEFACQVGKIVADEYEVWKTPDLMERSITTRGKSLWDDVFNLHNGQTYTRRDLLRESVCDTLASMRCGLNEPFAESDRKFMKRDRHLTEIFSSEEILAMISKIEDIIRRAGKFYDMIGKGQVLDTIQHDPEWFSDEELHSFHLAQNVRIAAGWTKMFRTDGPVRLEFGRHSKALDELAKGCQSKVEEELNKRQLIRETIRDQNHGGEGKLRGTKKHRVAGRR